MSDSKKKFRLFDAVLAAVCVVLVVESAAPASAIGNAQFFWWILLLLGFFLPYGMISSELGTTYEDEGGIYDWVKRAYGERWGSRVAWYYYINFPLWMGSLAVLFTDVIAQAFGLNMGTGMTLFIQLLFIWCVVLISSFKISDSKWIINIAAIFKALIMLSIGVLGIYAAVTKGSANEYTLRSFFPTMDLTSLSNVSIIIFNFLGFEVVTTFASEMKNPGKEIPKAIVLGGIFIAFFYVIASFGISVAIPKDKLSTSSGLIDSFMLLTGGNNKIIIWIFAVMFMYTLAANLISWSLGVNYVAMYAAKQNSLPKVFAVTDKNDMPLGANIVNGIIATVMVIAAPFIPGEDIFWSFFALNMVMLLMSYVPVFPAFKKLREIDKKKPHPFEVRGGAFKINLMTYLPMILVVASVIFSIVPFSTSSEELSSKLPLLFGTIIAIIIGEYFASRAGQKTN